MFSIRVQNLDNVIAGLRAVDSSMASELKRGIKQIVRPTYERARSYAGGLGLAPTGSYAGSLSLRTYANGVKFVSTDPGGGVIEFANPGAVILTGRRAGRRAGVPVGSAPPRALLRAVLEDEEDIVREVSDLVQETCDEGLLGLG